MGYVASQPQSIHLWNVPVIEAPSFLETVLSDREAERARSFRNPADQARALLSYGLLRLLLAEELAMAPQEVPVTRACPTCGKEHGKPRLAGASAESAVEISISHSGDWVVIGLSRHHPFGVDIEWMNRVDDLDGLAEISLSDRERQVWRALPREQHVRGFYRYWTRKEAIVKATGDGLTVSLQQVHVSPPDQAPRLYAWQGRPEMVDQIVCFPLELDAQTEGCVAVIGEAEGIEMHDGKEVLDRWRHRLEG